MILTLCALTCGLGSADVDAVWVKARAAYVQQIPALERAAFSLDAGGRAEVRLPRAVVVPPELVDELLGSLVPVLGGRIRELVIVGPAGERLTGPDLAEGRVAQLAGLWRANKRLTPRPIQDVSPTAGLSGLRIFLSAGHGDNYSDTLGTWVYQRDIVQDLREDLHTNEVVLRHLAPLLEAAGAEVVLARERSTYPVRSLVDNDGGDLNGSYQEVGAWQTGGAAGHGGSYRYASVNPGGDARATFSFDILRAQELPVYVWYLASANRTAEARFIVAHAAGEAVVTVDQQRDSERWHYLGTFPFAPSAPAAVSLSNEGSETGSVVIADAVRLGGGAGFADFGGGASGVLRWRQSARTYAVEEEVPETVTSGTNDVTVRPATALWQGSDLYLAVHTNAYNGGSRGTSSFVYSNAAGSDFDPDRATPLPPGTLALQDSIHACLIETFRAGWGNDWQDGGVWGANFGELRPITQAWNVDPDVVIPAVLVELAFHDNSTDARALREDRFRADAARALYRGILHYVYASAAAVAVPFAPTELIGLVTPEGVLLQWHAPIDPLEPSAVATHFEVQGSLDGVAYQTVATTEAQSFVVSTLSTCDARSYRVIAVNAGGRSAPSSAVVTYAVKDQPTLLWVDGTRRLHRTVNDAPEGPNTAARWLLDLPTLMGGGVVVSTARSEAVAAGTVSLAAYDWVLWTTGETSTVDESLTNAEQGVIAAYLAGGGALVLSGAELGWDLVEKGNANDIAFFQDTLHAAYLADDAGSFRVTPASDALWLMGLDATSFDDGTGSSFRVEYPDVLAPREGASAELDYGTGGVAALRWQGAGRLFLAGFPLETLEDDAVRAGLLDRLVAAMLDGMPAAPACGEAWVGAETDSGPHDDGGAVSDGGDVTPSDIGDALAGGDPAVEAFKTGVSGGCGCRATKVPWGVLGFGVVLFLRRRVSQR